MTMSRPQEREDYNGCFTLAQNNKRRGAVLRIYLETNSKAARNNGTTANRTHGAATRSVGARGHPSRTGRSPDYLTQYPPKTVLKT